jgi:hypothetical protein
MTLRQIPHRQFFPALFTEFPQADTLPRASNASNFWITLHPEEFSGKDL